MDLYFDLPSKLDNSFFLQEFFKITRNDASGDRYFRKGMIKVNLKLFCQDYL